MKVLLVTDVPDDCYEILAEITCHGFHKTQVHVLGFHNDELDLRRRAYEVLQERLEDMGIE